MQSVTFSNPVKARKVQYVDSSRFPKKELHWQGRADVMIMDKMVAPIRISAIAAEGAGIIAVKFVE